MPSSLHARMMSSAISPRLAMRTFSNMHCSRKASGPRQSPDTEEDLTELHRLAVLGHDFRNHAARFRFDFIHHFHRLDNADHGLLGTRFSNIDTWRRVRSASAKARAHHE